MQTLELKSSRGVWVLEQNWEEKVEEVEEEVEVEVEGKVEVPVCDG